MNCRPPYEQALVESPRAIDRFSPSCPLCNTRDRSMTPDSLLAGTGWSCAACGRTWTAARLDAFQRYAAAQ